MLIINPYSGKGLSRYALGTVISRLCDADHNVTVYFSREQTPEQLARSYAGSHDIAVCVGGDGTLSSLISGLLEAGISIPVGYIPAGTSNDIAATLALSGFPSAASRTIINGTPRRLDIGKFHDRYFTYIAAFGAFTSVSYQTPQSVKRALGHFAYVLTGIADMAAIKPRRTTIEYDGNTIEGEFIFGAVANSTSVARLVKLDPDLVDLSDGRFEIILVKQPIVPADFIDILASVAVKTYDGDNVQVLQASNIKFTFDEDTAWTVDGENGGMHREAVISVCHKAIEIIV